ncbi:MAG TPA: glycosyltransferase family A protein [Pusillimonas sp.]|uniref:glycosyltransferase family 2 protein n=1 Tax=Pusillimonas sp. TaxID=3040095 RepID=UPI002B7567CC|nr:glycosyltransferase family A protein [Pusillimonas sp.]HUH88475.1 glycosyltransferase family A protein [Pusillimonas sp.]
MSYRRHLFTVLTPTFNRAHTLARVYNSLAEQTFQDFEWLVIDDGSTDNTRELVMQWQQQARFPIRYIWQENAHKKTAFNHGVREARGELIVALDSDDSLDMNALYVMAQAWSAMDPSERSAFVAITGLCARPDGHIVGDMFPSDVFDTTSIDMSFKHHVKGEKFGCMRTEVLRRFPFPEDIPGFVPESVVWRAMARAGYLTRFVNQVFRVYYEGDGESLTGHSRSTGGASHALGLWLLAQDTVVECLPWFKYRPQEFFAAAARYTRFSLHIKRNGQALPRGRSLHGLRSRLLVALMWPVGVALYLRDIRTSRPLGV